MNNGIFNMLFDAAGAWNQMGYMFGGLVCLAFGGGLIGYFLYGHLAGKRIRGKVVSVRVIDKSAVLNSLNVPDKYKKNSSISGGDMYYAVYEYRGPDGKVHQSGDGSSSNGLSDKIPGASVWLYVNPRHPDKIMRAGLIILIFGLVFAAPGVLFLYLALTRFKFNIFTIIVPLAAVAHIVFKIKSKLKPHELHDKMTQFLADAKASRAAPDQPGAVSLPLGRELTRDEIKTILQASQKANRTVTPVLSLIGIALIAAGFYFGQSMAALLAAGQRAGGEVVRVESVYSSSNNGGYTYHSIVGFDMPDGSHREFRDKVGSNPPMDKQGDKVTVLYDPADPEHEIIDRGIWNWALSGGLALGGGLMLLIALKSLSNSRRISRL